MYCYGSSTFTRHYTMLFLSCLGFVSCYDYQNRICVGHWFTDLVLVQCPWNTDRVFIWLYAGLLTCQQDGSYVMFKLFANITVSHMITLFTEELIFFLGLINLVCTLQTLYDFFGLINTLLLSELGGWKSEYFWTRRSV